MSTRRPCLGCGEPAETTWCQDCQPPRTEIKTSAASRGYDHRWTQLSKRARRLQPFCSDCGAVDDLTADHSPTAWERKQSGKPIRLQDIDVVCRACNGRRGRARPSTSHTGRGETPHSPRRDPHGEAKFLSVIPHTEIIGSGGGHETGR